MEIKKSSLFSSILNEGETNKVIEQIFPSRDTLIYAGRLIGEERLFSETPEGLETAAGIFQQEINARAIFDQTQFCQERINELKAFYTLAQIELDQLQRKGTIPEQLRLVTARYNTYLAALKPEESLQMIEVAKLYRKGTDFSDDMSGLKLPPRS